MRKTIDTITRIFTTSLMAIMVVVACWQVFTRFILQAPSTISEEFLRFSLIWLTMIGGAYVYGLKKHIAIIFIAKKIPKTKQIYVQILVELCVLVFAIVILLMGGLNAFTNAIGQVSPSLRMPMEYLYLCLPVGGALFVIYAIFHLIDHVKEHKQLKEEAELS